MGIVNFLDGTSRYALQSTDKDHRAYTLAPHRFGTLIVIKDNINPKYIRHPFTSADDNTVIYTHIVRDILNIDSVDLNLTLPSKMSRDIILPMGLFWATVFYIPLPIHLYNGNIEEGMQYEPDNSYAADVMDNRLDIRPVFYMTLTVTNNKYVGHMIMSLEPYLYATPLDVPREIPLGMTEIVTIAQKFFIYWETGRLHGDINPGNILITTDNNLVVIDDVSFMNILEVNVEYSYMGLPISRTSDIKNEVYAFSKTVLDLLGHVNTHSSALSVFLIDVINRPPDVQYVSTTDFRMDFEGKLTSCTSLSTMSLAINFNHFNVLSFRLIPHSLRRLHIVHAALSVDISTVFGTYLIG
jgi:hypothetical protein